MATNQEKVKKLKAVLILGIAIRIFVFLFQDPFNNDYHFQVIKYIREAKKIPLATEMSQGYHPPLYYLLAQIFYAGDGTIRRLKILQSFSLLTSILTFIILFWLIKRFIQSPRAAFYSALLVALLPQFIAFGNFVSNDSLTNLFGALICLQAYIFIESGQFRHLFLLALWLGLGLLTKATFLAFIPVLIPLIIFVQILKRQKIINIVAQTLIFCLVFSSLGSYKFLQNYRHFGRPFIHNTDPLVQKATGWPWAESQKGTYKGLSSFLDWNIAKLVKEPTLSESTRHSYFLLLYGTLWYQYIHESNLEGNLTRFRYFGSWLYLLAIVPTVIIMAGGIKFLFNAVQLLRTKDLNLPFIQSAFSILTFLSTLAMIVYIGYRTDVWSCFQARLFFPAIWGMIVLFAQGLELIEKKARLFSMVRLFLWLLSVSFVCYFIIELLLLLKILPRLPV
jgi:4-amino-4-deoxy-L-arabinose transferase-like glycosyltransferase